MTFKEWWNSPSKIEDPSLLSHRECAEHAWNSAYEMQEDRISNLKAEIMELEEKLEIAEKDNRYLNKRLRDANEDVSKIARDNVRLRKELLQYEEPVEVDHVVYVATHNTEQDTFYVGTLPEIMEWCEDWNHGVSSLNFFRLGDEVRVGFVDMGKETRFGMNKSNEL